MRVVHFELSCVAVSGEPSIPLFCMFYKLISDGDWFTFAKRKDSVSQPYYSFMSTSTYPKEWKSTFIFVSAAMIPESPPLRDAKAAIEDSVLILSAEITLWGLLQGIAGMLSLWLLRDLFRQGILLSRRKMRKLPPARKKGPLGSLQVRSSSDDDNDEDLESRLVCKRKAAPPSSPKQVPVPRDIRLRLRSASGQKAFPVTRAASELPPTGVKGSLTKHLRSSSLVSQPLLEISHASIEIPTAPSSSRVRDKTPEVSVARIVSAFEISPHHATGTSKPSHFEGFASRSPLAPLFADALPVPYIPKRKITQSSVVGTSETARDFLTHAVPPSHRFMNSALRDDLFDDQYSMSICEGLFRGGAGVMLEQKERAWAKEMVALVEEKEELAAELKHQKELDSVSQEQLDTMYAELGITSDDNQKFAK
ncbi:hypothetical protein HanPI659440_Chr17g0700711 [Helianthus annuus]|nr:hypothetical protein HanPI659440_Chr17g0700711 [Helianthus annuus]